MVSDILNQNQHEAIMQNVHFSHNYEWAYAHMYGACHELHMHADF